MYETKKDLSSHGLLAPIVGHAGDGNFHSQILFKTDAELVVAKEAVKRMVQRAIALDGTCTVSPMKSFSYMSEPISQGEHGVGIGKREFLVEELGAGTVELMKTIKKTLDPLGLFNPGKVSKRGNLSSINLS